VSAFDGIVGQDAPIGRLAQLLAAGRLPQALVFQGPDAVGKATTARSLARALLCPQGADHPGPCDVCALLDAGNHPDFLLVTRTSRRPGTESEDDSEDDELRSVISVDQVRELTHLATRTPRIAQRRVLVIDPADRMNAEAQNALLKTLEEPPESSVLVLVTARPHLLLATVRSRCVAVRFTSLRPGELGRLLIGHGVDEREALARAALAEGRPGAALTLDLEAELKRRDALLEALERLTTDPKALADLAGFTAHLGGSSEETLARGLGMLESILRDVARAALSPADPGLIHADVRARIEALGARVGAPRAAVLVRSIDALRGQLRFHLNRTLVAEAVLAAVAGAPAP
jgi:DNA polymerase-3 subunit delta'